MKTTIRSLAILFLVCSMAGSLNAQEHLGNRPWDLGIWAGGGTSVTGGTPDTHAFNAGLRLGKVLTCNHGGGFLHGNLEWVSDLIPLYYVVQPGQNAYGVGINPVEFKWNFTRGRKVIPYLELGSGLLFTTHEVPGGTSRANFATHGGLGFHFFSRAGRAVTVNVRYEHISDAGLTSPNPGINTVQVSVGWNWFRMKLR